MKLRIIPFIVLSAKLKNLKMHTNYRSMIVIKFQFGKMFAIFTNVVILLSSRQPIA